MRKKRKQAKVTHVMEDGKILSDEEFMKKPYIVVAENNYEFHVKCNRALDPNYYVKEQLRRKFVLAERRRAELEAQQAEIAQQLQSM